jgi:hypothetical protein
VRVLNTLAGVVMDELELRLSARKAVSGYQEELARRELREEHIRALMVNWHTALRIRLKARPLKIMFRVLQPASKGLLILMT